MIPNTAFRLVIGEDEIIISRTSVYRLMSFDGIAAADIDVTTVNNAIMDGGYVQSVRIGMRDINIQFCIADKAQIEPLRAKLISFLNPKAQGTLYVTRSNITRRIYCQLATKPEFEQPNALLSVSVVLKCPQPYFLDETDTSPQYLTFVPTLNFPITFLPSAGMTTGIQITSDIITINNTGDAEIGIICEITADKGSITNPKITIDGVEYVRVIKALEIGDSLTINTNPGKKDIQFNGASEFIYDITSIFFSVPVGEHTIQISADAGVTNANSSFTYALKYLGV